MEYDAMVNRSVARASDTPANSGYVVRNAVGSKITTDMVYSLAAEIGFTIYLNAHAARQAVVRVFRIDALEANTFVDPVGRLVARVLRLVHREYGLARQPLRILEHFLDERPLRRIDALRHAVTADREGRASTVQLDVEFVLVADDVQAARQLAGDSDDVGRGDILAGHRTILQKK